jgi:hypothetical protein
MALKVSDPEAIPSAPAAAITDAANTFLARLMVFPIV